LLGVQLEHVPGDGRGSYFSIILQLPPDFTAAFLPPKPDGSARSVGLFRAGSCALELGRWAPRLGIRFIELDESSVNFDGYDVLIADEEAWQHADQAIRNSALGGKERRLILLGGPSTREFTCLESGLTRLQYPPSLATLALALERTREPVRISSANADTASGYGRRLDDHNNRDYSRLYSAAEAEANSKNLKAELDAFIVDMGSGLAKENDTALERVMKKYHDGFADAGALECAKLALAISINVRKVGARAMTERLSTIFDRRE